MFSAWRRRIRQQEVPDFGKLPVQHALARLRRQPPCDGDSQQWRDFGLHDHLGHQGAGIKRGRIEGQRVAGFQAKRGCVDCEIMPAGVALNGNTQVGMMKYLTRPVIDILRCVAADLTG